MKSTQKLLLLSLIIPSLFHMGCATNSGAGYEGFGADSLSQEVLQKYAPKPQDPQLLGRIQQMLDIRTTSAGMVSPDGKKLFFNWGVTGVSQIWRVDGPKQFPVQLTGGEDAASLKGMTPDGKWLLVSRDRKGDEQPGLFLQSTKGGPLLEIFRKKKVQVFLSWISADSRYIYYRANDKNPKSYAFYKYDIRTKKSETIFEGPDGYWLIADRWKDGTLLVANWKGNTASEYYTYSEKARKLVPLLGQDEMTYYDVSFGASKDRFLVRTNKFDEFYRIYELRKGKWKPVTPKWDYEVSSFQVDLPRKKIIYRVNNQGYFDIGALSASTYKKMWLPKLRKKKTLQVFYGSTTRNGRYTTLKVVNADAPAASYVYDWNTGRLKQWVLPSSPEIDTSGFNIPTLEHYLAEDGTKIPMFVRRPPECLKKVCPVIVNFHGGPEAQSYPWFSSIRQLFNDEGYIYAQPNVRGSAGYGKAWLDADNGPKRLDVITDIRDAARHIRKNWARGSAVPKIAIFGGSYGGYSTFAGMTMFAGEYDAGVAVVGMSSLVTFLQNTAPYRRHLRESEYGYLAKDMEALEKLSPINYIDKIQDPLLIVHGATDPRVPAGEAVQIQKVMEQKGLAGELLLFPDEGHGIRKRKNRAIYYATMLDFLRKNLKD